MPTAGKLFLYVEDLSLEKIHEALDGWSESLEYDDENLQTTLITDIVNLSDVDEDSTDLSGVIRGDGVEMMHHRTGPRHVAYTTSTRFQFFSQDGRNYVILMAAKQTANNVANKLSLILHDEVAAITVPKLNPRKLREFCEGSEAIKVLLFDDMDIPNMEKATLYGPNITQVNLYGQFVDSGQYRYSVSKLKDGYTVGIVADASVCIFNTLDTTQDYIDFVKANIVPMVI